ncbi:helix-turn-helix transcriptional regulator [Paenibacillus sp. strain BS8-2]
MDQEFENFHHISNMVHGITKLDIRFIAPDGHPLYQLVDHKLPSSFQRIQDEYEAIEAMLRHHDSRHYYFYENRYGLEYVAVALWEPAVSEGGDPLLGYFLVGPFLSTTPGFDFISHMMLQNKLPLGERNHLEAFYSSLTVVSSNTAAHLGELLVQLTHSSIVESVQISSKMDMPRIHTEQLKATIEENQAIIEMRYRYEKQFMHLITKGDLHGLQELIKKTFSIFNMPDRIPESPLRSAKNLLLTLNTLCRIAAERGGLHPVYIHHISEKLSIMIERSPNLPSLNSLRTTILEEYCEAVRTYATGSYGPIVRKAIDYIQFNLEKPLTLREVAEFIPVNPSHLSRCFMQETGQSFIDFMNRKKIEEAKLYLRSGSISITEIALMAGYNDLNYFGRVFKKVTGMTPSQYAKNVTV